MEDLQKFYCEFLATRITTKNGFAFSSGRLHFLRQFLQTQKIPFNVVLSIIERHQINSDDINRTFKSGELENILHDIFYFANKLDLISGAFAWFNHTTPIKTPFDPERQGMLLADFLSTIYDPNNSKCITILELKMSLLLLCSTKSMEELVQHYLNLLIDHNRCIHRTRFKLSTIAMLKLFNYLDKEVKVDTDTVQALVANSFEKVTGLAGLSDTQFYQLWKTENRKNPSEISYFFTKILFSRSMDNDAVHEGVFCVGCSDHNDPIQGVRFKCNRCSSLNLCKMCFLGDFQTSRHNPTTHKFTTIQEPATVDDKHIGLFAKLLKVIFFMRSKRSPSKNGNDSGYVEEAVKTIRFVDNKSAIEEGTDHGKDKLLTVIEMLSMENRVFQENLVQIQKTCQPESEFYKYLEQHKNILTAQIEHLQEIWKTSLDSSSVVAPSPSSLSPPGPMLQTQKFHSTPFRANLRTINWDLTALDASTVTSPGTTTDKSKYIRGEEIDKTYFEANRSNRSLQEISTWLHLRESFCRELVSFPSTSGQAGNKSFPATTEEGMQSFKELLHKVRDILEDTYSDNTQLSTVTRQLETVLDDIIGEEERKVVLKEKKAPLRDNNGNNNKNVKSHRAATKSVCQ